jgi:hypothetical protein
MRHALLPPLSLHAFALFAPLRVPIPSSSKLLAGLGLGAVAWGFAALLADLRRSARLPVPSRSGAAVRRSCCSTRVVSSSMMRSGFASCWENRRSIGGRIGHEKERPACIQTSVDGGLPRLSAALSPVSSYCAFSPNTLFLKGDPKKGGAGATSPIPIQTTGSMSILCRKGGRKKKKKEGSRFHLIYWRPRFEYIL